MEEQLVETVATEVAKKGLPKACKIGVLAGGAVLGGYGCYKLFKKVKGLFKARKAKKTAEKADGDKQPEMTN